jgi:ribonuclease VapC
MILDSSAVIAVLRAEPEAREFTVAMMSAPSRRLSAVNYVETAAVIDGEKDPVASRQLDDFFRATRITVESVTPQQAQIARQAYRDFGKGRHKAGLNLGDCFAYALAKDMDEPLLFKGKDFKHTDVERAEY